jgi:predicted kinase
MTRLIVTRGLPGSGKTTFARKWVNVDASTRARVNRDDIRQMLNEGYFEKGVTEQRVQAVRDAAIRRLLERGVDVICDDTNLPQRVARDLAKIAHQSKAAVEFVDFTHVPLETCLRRNCARQDKDPVPQHVIEEMNARFVAGKLLPLPDPILEDLSDGYLETRLYVPDLSLPAADIVDVDGTIALKGDRDPYDETRVHEDRPNKPVIELVQMRHEAGKKIVFCSGRTDGCRDATREWIERHVGWSPVAALHMRKKGDGRKDSLVKAELFWNYIAPFYNVQVVWDDRDQVVATWRAMGLTVMQVAAGNF